MTEGVGPPSGTVTFLFTDIEGSTRLWEQNPTHMADAVQRHDQILRDVIESHRGYVFTTAGDSFAAAFDRATDALVAATDAQLQLKTHHWPDSTPLRVRMGLHTGEAQERDDDYFGPTVNRAARLTAAGHGGQILLSATTAQLLNNTQLHNLGRHRLKDLTAAEHIWQAGDHRHPPLRTLDTIRHNLPIQRSEVFGRDDDAGVVADMLAAGRLVTLTGVGGAGKTRLALAVASRLLEDHEDGVFFVALAPVSDPTLVWATVAEAVGWSMGSADHRALASFLADREVLLVVDNCEHVIDEAAEFVDDVLAAGTACRVLATSREALEIEGERTFTVPSLDGTSPDSPAVRLVLDRAPDRGRDLLNDGAAIEAVVEVCKRLDGIPLALELAAAQLAHMSPQELETHLDDRFRLLVGERRGRLHRQQTLQTMMDWSWDLLSEPERDLLAQAAVFSDGWGLQAAEGVCLLEGVDSVVSTLGSLVAKSLVDVEDRASRGFVATRYRMLETVRLYGLAKLAQSDQTTEVRERHARYFSRAADAMPLDERFVSIPAAARWNGDMGNIRTAVDWLDGHGRLSEAAALITMPALAWRGSAAPPDVEPIVDAMLGQDLTDSDRALVLLAAAELAWSSSDIAGIAERARPATDLGRRHGDDVVVSAGLWLQGVTLQVSDPDGAEQVLRESAERAATAGSPSMQAAALALAADLESMGRRRPDAARSLIEEARALASTDGFENLVISAAECSIEIVAGNWPAADRARRNNERIRTELGLDVYWAGLIEAAVIAAELGVPLEAPLAGAVAELRAAGGEPDRPDLLLIPLGAACRDHDWARAAKLIAGIRHRARSGVSFISPHTTAVYLHYRDKVPREAVTGVDPEPIAELVRSELHREASHRRPSDGGPAGTYP